MAACSCGSCCHCIANDDGMLSPTDDATNLSSACDCTLHMCKLIVSQFCRYDNFLFYGRSPEKEMSYETHLSFIKNLFLELGIMSRKKTHAPRGSGARDSYDRK